MLTIRAEIKKGEQKSDGTYNVKLRFTHQRKVKRLSTSLFVRPQDLTKSLSFKNGTSLKKDSDKLVYDYQMRCNKLPIDIEGYTLDEIMGELEAQEKRKQSIDFIQFCNEWINETSIKGKGNYTIWQKSQTGKLTGIPKSVDIDVFRKDKGISDIMLAQ